MGIKTSFEDRQRCGFIWAEGDRTSGRGMGKTALAVYMKHKINEGFGVKNYPLNEKFFCVYVSFNQQMVAKIGLFFQEAINALIKDKKILKHLAENLTESELIDEGISQKFASAIVGNNMKQYFEDIVGHPLGQRITTKDWRYDNEFVSKFMNDLVICFQKVGFLGAVLIIDDFENLTDKSTPKNVENFIKDFGIAFFRGDSRANDTNFYSVVITTHQQSAQKISLAWTVAGLSASFPLASSGPSSVFTEKPNLEHCIDIVEQFLKFNRIKVDDSLPRYFPFTESAIKKVIEDCDFHPRRFLSQFSRIIISALGANIPEINELFVQTVEEGEDIEENPGIEDL